MNSRKPIKLLIIDDEVGLRSLLSDVFSLHYELFPESEYSYEVITASRGQESIDVFDSELPDAVITDIMMPDFTGLEILKHIRSTMMRIPVLVLTAIHDDRRVKEAFDLGADDYILKPFDVEDIE